MASLTAQRDNKIKTTRSYDTVRIFISSTFNDMQVERDQLIAEVYPELEERLTALDLEFSDIDLRWGVPGKDEPQLSDELTSWDYCRAGIDHGKPFFIVLLGNNYGTTIDSETFEKVKGAEWSKGCEQCSYTELEIRYTTFNQNPDRFQYIPLFYFRDDTKEPALDKRLEQLKSDIVENFDVRRFTCEPSDGQAKMPSEFYSYLREDLWSAVLRDTRYVSERLWQIAFPQKEKRQELYQSSTTIDEKNWKLLIKSARQERTLLDREERQLARFRRDRTRWFFGREEELGKLVEFSIRQEDTSNHKVQIISAPPGRGKTALLSALVDRLKEKNPELIIADCFIGAIDRTASEIGVLNRLLDIVEPSTESTTETDYSLDQLGRRLSAVLRKRKKPLLIVIDGVDQLSSKNKLEWLADSDSLGSGVKIILSLASPDKLPEEWGAISKETLASFKKRFPEASYPQLSELKTNNIGQIADSYFDEYGKLLTPEQKSALLSQKETRNPLYLMIMLREMRALSGVGLYEQLPERIRDLAKGAADSTRLFAKVLKRVELLGGDVAGIWNRSLLLARDGFSPQLLADIVTKSLGDKEKGRNTHHIRRALREYLQTRNGRITYYHKTLQYAARNCYPTEDSKGLHQIIACALLKAWRKGDRFAMTERIYHLAQAGEWQALIGILRNSDEWQEFMTSNELQRQFTIDLADAYVLAEKAEEMSIQNDMVTAFLKILSSDDARTFEFTPTEVNDWLAYRKDKLFALKLWRTGARLEQSIKSLPILEQEFAYRCRSRLAGEIRRKGGTEKLKEAEDILSPLLGVAKTGASRAPTRRFQITAWMRAILKRPALRTGLDAYELGYIAFLRGDYYVAQKWFLLGAKLSQANSNYVGSWISRCLVANCKFIGQDDYKGALKILNEAEFAFEKFAKQGYANAQRWVMNVNAHRLEVAVAMNDIDTARKMHKNLLDDKWLVETERLEYLLRYEGMFAYVNGNFEEAVAYYQKIPALSEKDFSPENYSEALARHAHEYGLALRSRGNEVEAVNIWSDALILPADAGNAIWQQKIEEALG